MRASILLFMLLCVCALAGAAPAQGTGVTGAAGAQQGASVVPPPPPAPSTLAEGAPVAGTGKEEAKTSTVAEQVWVKSAGPAFGPEAAEKPTPGIFTDAEVVKRLLGEPAYVYIPGDLRNPMVIPWRRMHVVGYELLDAGTNLMDKGDIEHARDMFLRIMQEFPNTEVAQTAAKKLDEVEKILKRQGESGPKEAAAPKERPFPVAVAHGVVGILAGDKPQVLINDDIVGVGETVPGYEEVMVKRIEKRNVVFEFDNKERDVPLDASMPDMKGTTVR